MNVIAAHGSPRLPRDPQDHQRDGETDQWVEDLCPDRDGSRTGDDGE